MGKYIYLIGSDDGHTKIGISGNPQERLRELQTSTVYQLSLVFYCEVDNPRSTEDHMHGYFYREAVRGEWFKLSQDNIEAFKDEVYWIRSQQRRDSREH